MHLAKRNQVRVRVWVWKGVEMEEERQQYRIKINHIGSKFIFIRPTLWLDTIRLHVQITHALTHNMCYVYNTHFVVEYFRKEFSHFSSNSKEKKILKKRRHAGHIVYSAQKSDYKFHVYTIFCVNWCFALSMFTICARGCLCDMHRSNTFQTDLHHDDDDICPIMAHIEHFVQIIRLRFLNNSVW